MMNRHGIGQACALAIGVVTSCGCATTQPPRELLDARAAYQQAQKGRAPELDPASLHEAKVELDKAERAFEEDGRAARVRDIAYIAARKAELAEVSGQTAFKRNELTRIKAENKEARTEHAQQQTAALEEAKQRLQNEQEARKMAEQRAHQAMERLAAMNTKVREEPRGTIITLPGTVLFASGESQLLPSAQDKLASVGEALKEQANVKFEIEGHTDSQGSYDLNMDLSKRRADAVAGYLASQGIERSRIQTVGYGATQPVADNGTPAGRADNRRVEIVVKRAEN